jgi:undecaprenyl-diphosphatase
VSDFTSRRIWRGVAALGVLLVVLGGSAWATAATGTDSGAAGALDELTTAKAAVLGVIEGITEYLPVSSTGHLTVAERLLDVGQHEPTKDAIKYYTVIIQIGAILAVLVIFWSRIVQMVQGLFGRSEVGRRTLIALVIAFIPAAVTGVALEKPIEDKLFGPFPVAIAWIVGGIGILLFARRQKRTGLGGQSLDLITSRQAAIIGASQVLALWPGTSRSLVTIIAAVLVGLSLQAAVEFSFLLGLATLSAATLYTGGKHGSEVIDAFGVGSPLVGIVVAGVAAFVAVRWMIGYLNKHDLSVFGWYRLAIGVATMVLLATSVL